METESEKGMLQCALSLCEGSDLRAQLLKKVFARCKIAPGKLETPCWEWEGPTSGDGRGGGYGRMSWMGQTVSVHRAVFTAVFGFIPGKKQVDHKCENRSCCNPDHLEAVTHKTNQKRKSCR